MRCGGWGRMGISRKHRTVFAVYQDRVVGGVTFRSFPERKFVEIVFFVVSKNEQVRGFGSQMMCFLKMEVCGWVDPTTPSGEHPFCQAGGCPGTRPYPVPFTILTPCSLTLTLLPYGPLDWWTHTHTQMIKEGYQRFLVYGDNTAVLFFAKQVSRILCGCAHITSLARMCSHWMCQ